MKKLTLEKMQRDSTLSEIQRMAAGCLIETRKKNGHRDIDSAAAMLGLHYDNLSWDERVEYVTIVADAADDIEWFAQNE